MFPPISLRDRGVSDEAYVGSILWLLGASGVRCLVPGCPYSDDLCGVFAAQREGDQLADRESQSGLAKAFHSVPSLQLVDVSGVSFSKVVACLPVPSLPGRMPFKAG